jgi:hypothetical protein
MPEMKRLLVRPSLFVFLVPAVSDRGGWAQTSASGKPFTDDISDLQADLLKARSPYFLAGGLSPDAVAQAARSVFTDMLADVTDHFGRPPPATATVSDITSNVLFYSSRLCASLTVAVQALQRLVRTLEYRDVVESLVPSSLTVGSAADASTALGAFMGTHIRDGNQRSKT